MGVTLNEISFEIGQFHRLVSEAVVGIAEGPPPSADDAENTSEAHLQALGRFIVGYGTEEDDKTREYSFDFCGHPIKYDAQGKPVEIHPVSASGYSLGSLQWDFGQQKELSGPFITSFLDWHRRHPQEPNMVSEEAFAVRALKSDGHVLEANPAIGLYRQDVLALTHYAQSDEGSDWVNKNIDQVLIGSDAQHGVDVGTAHYGLSCVGAGRLVEITKAFLEFKSKRRWDMTDLIYSIAMKSSNQHGETGFKRTFLPFLQQVRTSNEIAAFYKQKGGGDGIEQATNDNAAWARFQKLYPSDYLDKVKIAMQTNSLDNPYVVSKRSGWYVLAKQVFETPDIFEKFLKAIANDADMIVASLFDSHGAVARNPHTGHFMPGMLRQKGKLFVWDGPGNAFTYENRDWTSIDIARINTDSAAPLA